MEKELENLIEEFDLKEQIQHILSLEDNYDNENSPGYKGKENFVYLAIRYIPIMTELIKNKLKIDLYKSPHMHDGDNGSIDFLWKTEKYSLLLNVPENSAPSYAMISGKNCKDKCLSDLASDTLIKGKLGYKTYEHLIKDQLYKKLEKIITRNFWENQIFNKKEFAVYCEAVKIEAELHNPDFIESEKYKELTNMDNNSLKKYLLEIAKTDKSFPFG